MLESPISDHVWLDRRGSLDGRGVVQVSAPSRRKDLICKLPMVESARVPRKIANSILVFAAELLPIHAKTVQVYAPKLPIADTSAKITSSASIEELRYAHE